jgi:hypothetical protein
MQIILIVLIIILALALVGEGKVLLDLIESNNWAAFSIVTLSCIAFDVLIISLIIIIESL